jgi:hypothetical protein
MRFRGSMLTQGTLTIALTKTQGVRSRLPTPVEHTRHWPLLVRAEMLDGLLVRAEVLDGQR